VLCVTGATGVMFGLDQDHAGAALVGLTCFALLAAAALWSWRHRPSVEVSRQLPDCLTAGTSARYTLCVINHGAKPASGLLLRDGFTLITAAGAPAPRRWRRPRPPATAVLDPVAVPTLASDKPVSVIGHFMPERRGTVVMQRVEALRPDPLGLMYARTVIDTAATTIVLPALLPVPRLPLPSHRRYQRGGVQLAGAVADAQEFVRLRDYRTGDPIKNIHWRAWARYDRPIVREYQDEFFDRQGLVVDTFLADRPPAVLDAVLSVAASFAAQPQRPDGLLDLLLIGSEAIHVTSGRGVTDRRALLRALALAEARPPAEFDRLTALVCGESSGLSGAVVLLGCWDERRAALLAQLRQRGIRHRALVVVTSADGVADLPGDGAALPLRIDHLAADLRRLAALP
jgi:uncharacterized protein (DUF58 family)